MDGIDIQIIERALKEGILYNNNGVFEPSIGNLALVYVQEFHGYLFAFGTNAINAKHVLVKDYGNSWRLK